MIRYLGNGGWCTVKACENNSRSENTSWLRKMIVDFVNNSPENRIGGSYDEKAWTEPLVGFSRGDDPYYDWLKKDIGDFLFTPYEIFAKTFPTVETEPSDLSVICWILPQTEATKTDMRRANRYPAERAALASRVNGEIFNQKIAKYVADTLNENGYETVVPVMTEHWGIRMSEKYGKASSWSEKHAAFISGLGTFSLTDTLITELGTAVRIGSVVSRIRTEATERKYSGYGEYCLHLSKGGCMKCADRCPAGAINENGHDKAKCEEYQGQVTSKYINENYKINVRYCGLCQFNVPCESCIPE